MNFIFDGCFFGTNNIYIQNNNTFILPERTPFADVTEKMKNFFNIQKNKPFNAFSKNFNDNSNEAKEFQFLKKKSFGEYMNSTKENKEKIESKESINKSSKYLNNLYKKQNSIISNLDEDVDESDKENLSFINKKDSDSDNESIDINQILSDTIKEKKDNDKYERERKKINKMKQLKLLLKNRKNSLDYTYKKNEGENKENININIVKNIGSFEGAKREKEISMMSID